MIRTIQSVDKSVFAVAAFAVTVPTNVSTQVLKDIRKVQGQEYVCRLIQNVGANNAYYAIGQDSDNITNFHGVLAQGQQADLSIFPLNVTVFSVGGTTIAVTEGKRGDITTHQNILPS